MTATATHETPALGERGAADATLQHIAMLSAKRRTLLAAQAEAEEQFAHSVGRMYRAGQLDLDDLLDLYLAFRDASDRAKGFSTRWNSAVPVSPGRLFAWEQERGSRQVDGPAGSWAGDWPGGKDDPLPPARGFMVYVLFDERNEPCYVGSSGQLRQRLGQHARDGKQFAHWTAYECPSREEAFALEDRLLAEHKPYLNKKSGR